MKKLILPALIIGIIYFLTKDKNSKLTPNEAIPANPSTGNVVDAQISFSILPFKTAIKASKNFVLTDDRTGATQNITKGQPIGEVIMFDEENQSYTIKFNAFRSTVSPFDIEKL